MNDKTGPTSLPGPDQTKAPLSALKPLLPAVAAYKGRALAALLALLTASAATLALPLAVRRVVDHGFSGERGLVDTYFAALILVVAVLAAASALRFYFVMTLGERVVADLRGRVFAHLTRLDPGFYDTVRSGELVSRLSADTTQLKSAFGASASIALRNLLLFFGAVAMMIVTSPKLSLLVLGAIPLIVLPLVFSGRAVRKRAKLAQDRLAEASAFAAEAVGAIRTMQSFGRESASASRYAAAAEEAYGAARDATRSRAWLTAAVIFLISSSVVGVLWYGALEVLAGRMSGGRLSQFVLYAVFAASGLGQLSEVWSEVSQAAGAAQRLSQILATAPRIEAPANPVAMPVPPRGEIVFEDVHFAFPTNSDRSALRGISFRVAPGERLAIVGPSGAGKSTLFQVLLRFYDPQSGEIRVDNVPIRQADPRDLRSRIAYVPQEPVLFADTIAENIRYGRPDASLEEIENAAKLAAADGFIAALAQGYAALIGERGITLSGGQRQRIAIARAILKDAPILLLDEATSALDSESEAAVQTALDRLMKGRTTLVIAHRLATVLKADRIFVMDGGRIVEEGTHATLLAKDGLYARLARLQFEEGKTAMAAQ